MPRTYAVDLDQLQQRVDEMVAYEGDVEKALDHLAAVVDRLHLTWTGLAADAHREAHREWVTGMQQMKTGLAEVRAAAERAHGNYGSAAAANVKMWAQVR